MYFLPRNLRIAVEAVIDIAINSHKKPLSNRELTERHGVSNRYLESSLQTLVHHGILKGRRGPNGGYLLAKSKSQISIGDIVRSLSSLSIDILHRSSSLLLRDNVKPLWTEIQEDLLSKLDKLSLSEILNHLTSKNV